MYLRLVAGLAVLFVTFTFTKTAQADTPFTECSSRTGSSATITIPVDANPTIDGDALPVGAEIATFTEEGICAGRATWEGENVALVAWGNDSQTEEKDGFESGEDIAFRVWNPDTGDVYEGEEIDISFSDEKDYYITEAVFQSGGIYVLSELEIIPIVIVDQDLSLEDGWNIISLNIELDDMDIEVVLDAVLDDIVLVKNAEGDVYSPEFGINDIGTWQTDEAYWVYAVSGVSFTLEGSPLDPSSTPITLFQTWELAPYIGTTAISPEDAFSSIDDALVIVQDAAGNVYFPEYGINDIGNVQPGLGYLVYVFEEATLVFP